MRYLIKLVIILTAATVVYAVVWQRVQVIRIGYEISVYEQKKSALKEQQRQLWLKASRVKSVKKVKALREDAFGADLRVVELTMGK